MNTERDTTRIVRSWLRTDERESADRVLDAVLDRLDTTPQRRAIWWRVPALMSIPTGPALATAAAAMVIVALLGLQILFGRGPNIGTDHPPSASPSPSAAVTRPLPLEDGPLSAGRYSIGDPYPVGISFAVPEGWAGCGINPYEEGVCRTEGGGEPGVVAAFLVVENVVADPCRDVPAVPPVGPTVDDLVEAISSLPAFTASEPVDVMVGGYPAKRFTVTAPSVASCELRTWMTPDRTNGVGMGEVNLLVIVDVDGERLMISVAYHPLTVTDADLQAADDLIESIELEP